MSKAPSIFGIAAAGLLCLSWATSALAVTATLPEAHTIGFICTNPPTTSSDGCLGYAKQILSQVGCTIDKDDSGAPKTKCSLGSDSEAPRSKKEFFWQCSVESKNCAQGEHKSGPEGSAKVVVCPTGYAKKTLKSSFVDRNMIDIEDICRSGAARGTANSANPSEPTAGAAKDPKTP